MRCLRFFINFFNRGNKIVRRVIGIHLLVVCSFYFFDFFASLFKTKEVVYTVQLVSTAPDTGGTTTAMQKQQPPPEPPQTTKPPTPKQPEPSPTPKAAKQNVTPKNTLKRPKQDTVKRPNKQGVKPPVKPSKIRSTTDIEKEMAELFRQQPRTPKRKVTRYELNESRLKANLSKAIKTTGRTSQQRTSSASGSYNYSSYYSQVSSKLYDLWAQPSLGGKLEVTIELTIAKSGRITAKRITDRSGNAIMDNSVKGLLAGLSTLPPLPNTSTDESLTLEAVLVLDN